MNHQPHRTDNPGQPVRSVMVIHDEDWAPELVGILLNKYLPGVQTLPFMIRDAAWEALTKAPPDLLITDLRDDNVPRRPPLSKLTGLEMLRFLAKPYTPELFHQAILKAIDAPLPNPHPVLETHFPRFKRRTLIPSCAPTSPRKY